MGVDKPSEIKGFRDFRKSHADHTPPKDEKTIVVTVIEGFVRDVEGREGEKEITLAK